MPNLCWAGSPGTDRLQPSRAVEQPDNNEAGKAERDDGGLVRQPQTVLPAPWVLRQALFLINGPRESCEVIPRLPSVVLPTKAVLAKCQHQRIVESNLTDSAGFDRTFL